MDKPKFKIPSMEEVRKIKPNGYKVVSTFSGSGGSCLGYRMAGFKILWANEFIPAAQRVYKLNHPDSILDKRDIRKILPMEILQKTGLKKGEVDILDGSPPCASFSTSGKRDKEWGNIKVYSETMQVTDDLFFEYIRIIEGLKPKVFLAENVAAISQGKAVGYFNEILRAMINQGYKVKASILDSSLLGIPQQRQRMFFMGVREDLKAEPVFPTPLHYQYIVREAWEGLVQDDEGLLSSARLNPGTQLYRLWQNTIPGHKFSRHIPGNAKYYTHRKISLDNICPTIQVTTDCYHPEEPRRLSIAEVKRLTTYPDDFILTGNYSQRWERCGRSVPPLMMKRIAEVIKSEVLDDIQ